MKKYTLSSGRDLGHFPYGFVVIDTGVLVHGAIGNHDCVRILYSQDNTDLRFAFPRGVEKEVKRVLKRDYKSRGLKWTLKQLNKKFINIDVRRDFYPRGFGRATKGLDMSYVDSDIIKLCLIDNAKCVVSRDLKDIVHNPRLRTTLHQDFQLPKDKLYTPGEFCEKYDNELVPYEFRDRLSTRWRIFKDRLSTLF